MNALDCVACPFCGEDDFDLIGLKMHLMSGWCEVFDKLQISQRDSKTSRPFQ